MKLTSWKIEPNRISFELEAENDAEIALFEFCENQALQVCVDPDWSNKLLLTGSMQR